ncbi:hypothetical protein PFISCL1PPCAC_8398, partial [Pristionchus fissidentatus]
MSPEEITTEDPITTEEPTTTEEPPTTTGDPCTTCAMPPPFDCLLDGYDCPAATDAFVITTTDCSILTCPNNDLLADNVPVLSLTCNSDGAWY